MGASELDEGTGVPLAWRSVKGRNLPDNLTRSLAMLSPGHRPLDREQAMMIVAQLEDAEQRLAHLIIELRRMAAQAERR